MTATNMKIVITDGTPANTVSLEAAMGGAHLLEWLPNSPQPINSVWAANPYQDGKHLVSKPYDNIIDSFLITVNGTSQDNTIHNLRRFLTLLEKAVRYWTDEYSTHRFWLEARSVCETNIRYALVVDYNIPNVNDPNQSPFKDAPGTTGEITLAIEHTIWQDDLTVGATCAKIIDGNNGPLLDSATTGQTNRMSSAGSDDGYIYSGSLIDIASNNMVVGKDAAGSKSLGMRFTVVNIPAGSTILEAYIIFQAAASDTTYNQVQVAGELNAAPATFSTYANFVGRTRTTNKVVWAMPAFTSGMNYYSCGVKDIVQEIVNLGGWVAGNNMVLFIEDHNTGSATTKREIKTFETGGLSWPVLHVLYSNAAGTYHAIGNSTPSCERRTFIQNHWRSQNFTHIFIDDGGVFGANQAYDHGANWDLLPAVPVANDAVYFGISGDIGSDMYSSTFNSLVLDLTTAPTSSTYILEYYVSPGVWSACAENPGVGDIMARTAGPGVTMWNYPSNWAQCTINGVVAWWVRIRCVTAVAATGPHQRIHTVPFTVSWNFIQVSGTEISGDISAFIDFLLAGYYGEDMVEHVLVGARKVSRDGDSKFNSIFPFTPFMTYPEGVTNELGDATAVTRGVVDSTSYYGNHAAWTEMGASTGSVLGTLRLPAKTYAGRYRAFIRCRPDNTTAVGEFALKLNVVWEDSNSGYATQWVYNKHTNKQEVIDLGVITFPSGPINENPPDATLGTHAALQLVGKCTGAIHVHLYDLIILPVDEMFMDIYNNTYNWWDPTENFAQSLKVITSDLKTGPRGVRYYADTFGWLIDDYYVIEWDDQYIKSVLDINMVGPFLLDPNEAYYLHFFIYTESDYISDQIFQCLTAPSLDKSQRYLLLRGNE